MTPVPTEHDIELAMERYVSDTAEGGIETWRAMKWLWKELPWPARIIPHLGIALDWWKQKYVLPLLCRFALPFLERFAQSGEACSERRRRWSVFFAPIAVADPQLFPPKMIVFLSEACRAPLRERREERGERREERTQRQSYRKELSVGDDERVPQRIHA